MIFGKFFGKMFGTGRVKNAAAKAKVTSAPAKAKASAVLTVAQMAAMTSRMPSHGPNPHTYTGGGAAGRFGHHRPTNCRGKSNRRKAARLAHKRR